MEILMQTELPKLDQVKFRAVGGGKWKYASFEKYNPESKKHWPTHYLLSDAISGRQFLVPNEGSYEVVDIPHGPFRDHSRMDDSRVSFYNDEYGDHIDKEWAKAQAKSEKVEGCKAGKMFKVGVADGYACYVVTRAGKKNVTIEWRNFACDAYHDQVLGWGGSFPRHCIEPLIGREEALANLFKKS
jgi:hypothetical protein